MIGFRLPSPALKLRVLRSDGFICLVCYRLGELFGKQYKKYLDEFMEIAAGLVTKMSVAELWHENLAPPALARKSPVVRFTR